MWGEAKVLISFRLTYLLLEAYTQRRTEAPLFSRGALKIAEN
jgi:hypothetical protein